MIDLLQGEIQYLVKFRKFLNEYCKLSDNYTIIEIKLMLLFILN